MISSRGSWLVAVFSLLSRKRLAADVAAACTTRPLFDPGMSIQFFTTGVTSTAMYCDAAFTCGDAMVGPAPGALAPEIASSVHGAVASAMSSVPGVPSL